MERAATPCRVLVVDDEPSIREVVSDALAFEGYVVEQAANGQEALQVVERDCPTVVLLDMRMPVMDGWAFASALHACGLPVPVVVMTAAQSARRWAAEVGAASFLAKPFDVDDLLQTVARFCTAAASGRDARHDVA